MAVYTLPDLPYDYAALEPHISGQIMELHHDKHHAAYVTGANTALEKLAEARETGDLAAVNLHEKNLAFNLGGHINHSVFWTQPLPRGRRRARPATSPRRSTTTSAPSTAFQTHFAAVAAGVQGSGWADPRLGLPRPEARHRPAVRPAGQHRPRPHPGPHARHVGARLLPRLPERQGRLRQGLVEPRQLGRRAAAPRARTHPDRRPHRPRDAPTQRRGRPGAEHLRTPGS